LVGASVAGVAFTAVVAWAAGDFTEAAAWVEADLVEVEWEGADLVAAASAALEDSVVAQAALEVVSAVWVVQEAGVDWEPEVMAARVVLEVAVSADPEASAEVDLVLGALVARDSWGADGCQALVVLDQEGAPVNSAVLGCQTALVSEVELALVEQAQAFPVAHLQQVD
jgi:hypothetical protein